MSRDHNYAAVLLLLAGCAVGAAAGYMRFTAHHADLASQAPVTVTVKPQMPNIESQLNEQLKDTAIQTELQREATRNSNAESNPLPNHSLNVQPRQRVIPLVLKQQNNLPKDLQGQNLKQNYTLTPSARISLMLKQNEEQQDYNRRYRRAYVEQFLKNAHEHGVNIQLNKNLDVTGVSIDTNNRPLLFVPTKSQSSSRK